MPKPAAALLPPLVLAIEGPSGAGKTAVSEELGHRLGVRPVAEAYHRLHERVPLEYGSRSELVELELMLLAEESRRFLEARAGRAAGACVLLDTGFLGPLTYTWGLREGGGGEGDPVSELLRAARTMIAEGRFGLPDVTVYLDLPEDLASVRATRDPTGHPPGLRERHRAVGRYERFLYEREFPRCLPGRFTAVSGEPGPPEVARALLDRLERFGPIPAAEGEEAERVVALFEGPTADGPPARRRSPNP